MARQLFGTDGIRGVAGRFPLDAQTAHAVGVTLGRLVARLDPDPVIILGMDTRESSSWLAGQVAGGLVRERVRVRFAGLVTTPGIAHLTRTNRFVAGVMISASHNLYQYNGIKVFGHSGYKFPDEQEHLLEEQVLKLVDDGLAPAAARLTEDTELGQCYLDHLVSTFSLSLRGTTIAVDCAHGAASTLAPELFDRLGAQIHTLGCSPNGRNINLGCGALHVETLREAVTAAKADLGVALDGDADRAIFVSRSGRILDGDAVLLMAARFLLGRGQLPGPTVVATVMSNLGLERSLARHGIRLFRTPVGDKYVLEEMLRCDALLGGEQSGHVIFRHHATTGDGLLTTLRVLEIMCASNAGLDELTQEMEHYPQRLVNVPATGRKPLQDIPEVAAEVRAARESFGTSGRVLVRYSGTEPLARVMVEGPDPQRVDEFANRIAAAVQRAVGSESS
jgi:phosphoglucosamine mutase